MKRETDFYFPTVTVLAPKTAATVFKTVKYGINRLKVESYLEQERLLQKHLVAFYFILGAQPHSASIASYAS